MLQAIWGVTILLEIRDSMKCIKEREDCTNQDVIPPKIIAGIGVVKKSPLKAV
jgi:hypothetical protein